MPECALGDVLGDQIWAAVGDRPCRCLNSFATMEGGSLSCALGRWLVSASLLYRRKNKCTCPRILDQSAPQNGYRGPPRGRVSRLGRRQVCAGLHVRALLVPWCRSPASEAQVIALT